MSNLGNVLRAQGKLAEAEPLLREALEVFRRKLGNEHPGTLKSINYLGLLLRAQGEYDEAEALLREALEGRRRQLGDEHPITLTVSRSLDALLKEKQESETPAPDPPSEDTDGNHP
jgi:tetratricopeptide (TPR) repeat protein